MIVRGLSSYKNNFNRSLISAFDQVVGEKKANGSQSNLMAGNSFQNENSIVEEAVGYNNADSVGHAVKDISKESLKRFLPGKLYKPSDLVESEDNDPKYVPLFRSNNNSSPLSANLAPETRRAVDIFRRNKYSTDMLHKVVFKC